MPAVSEGTVRAAGCPPGRGKGHGRDEAWRADRIGDRPRLHGDDQVAWPGGLAPVGHHDPPGMDLGVTVLVTTAARGRAYNELPGGHVIDALSARPGPPVPPGSG